LVLTAKEIFSIALPKDLKEWLENEAIKEKRSRNNLIEWILERYRESCERVDFTEKRIREPAGAIVG